jgi:AcrR family transcriptional regulator
MTSDTKERIVDAALQTLKEEGFAGTSARAIARRGDFNQALIFYHFGTLNDLLLAALDRTSDLRMAKYRDAVEGIASLPEAVRVATELYREDLASGHITVLSELIAGSLDRPDLAPEIVRRMEQWLDLTESVVERLMSSIGIAGLVQTRTVAHAISALYLGIDLMSHLEQDDSRAEEMFAAAQTLAGMVSNLTAGR